MSNWLPKAEPDDIPGPAREQGDRIVRTTTASQSPAAHLQFIQFSQVPMRGRLLYPFYR